ncbi:retron Ec67 family RNA-directed DNA polymerase/endonuclease [Glaciimonas sp. Gout2]|uniref:retron Ec67 family RNA-directed DNA polymerase/endonuclease n=1 Tax=unclassified Glaciimonas TaxID=2644401 RepID=UPI002B23AF7A|nr:MULTISPECIES: retron Ec67 family RNA-directed DNA polymerase/endonuclease [unclassified Glaciimonas]MEB0012550.1 retron Ec67 family RNA-directed DNA polymerase/endonuclease [Glaciimonas sp. Cout2]MEB0083901.1 retron Ec67 family RNA-directed DNA polymerase/endonuclease [Glaciimonas sp. Gout2]
MPSLRNLQEATSLSEIAPLLKISARMLSFLLFKKPKLDLYQKFDIPKRHGGVREIHAPERNLKLLQHRLSILLQECISEINVTHGHVENEKNLGIAHGFKRYHTIMTNGRPHVARRYVFNVDLHDFFGSMNFGRVRGFFMKDKNFNLHPNVATVIAQIACHENKLPQGSPCSPVISNLIGHTMDIPLVRLALSEGLTYTRYADDLTFSTNKPIFSSLIAIPAGGDKWMPGRSLEKIVARSGFSFNDRKTRMQYQDSRQEVTGLTVNRKVNVPATYRNRVRAMAHALFNTGEFEFINKKRDISGNESVYRSKGKRNQLLGMLSYIDQVDRFNKKLREDNKLEPDSTTGRITLFRRFLYFDAFYAADEPIIVCEGKTDNVYLRCAIKSLAPSYPKLIVPGKIPQLKVQFLKYADRRISQITELTGGVGGICKLLKNYHEDVKTKFKAPAPKHPVIVIIDNDSGADSIYGAIAGITKKTKPAGRANFIHVFDNLYVIPTPFGPQREQTAIEDFFDKTILATKLNGKEFSRRNDMENPTHYGKSAFAINVVAKNANIINFNNFTPILDRMIEVIDDYQKRLKTSPKP